MKGLADDVYKIYKREWNDKKENGSELGVSNDAESDTTTDREEPLFQTTPCGS
jgi:hypothetical protein